MGNDIPITKKNKSDKILVCLPYDKEELFLCLNSAVIEFIDNTLTILAQEAHVGRDMQSAAVYLEEVNSIPESEPLYKIIKSRAININKIKDKNEKKYWRDLKEINKIPDIYKPIKELERELKEKVKERGIKDVK